MAQNRTLIHGGAEPLAIDGFEAAIDLENRNQLLVRLTTQNLQEYIKSRKEGRDPVYRIT